MNRLARRTGLSLLALLGLAASLRAFARPDRANSLIATMQSGPTVAVWLGLALVTAWACWRLVGASSGGVGKRVGQRAGQRVGWAVGTAGAALLVGALQSFPHSGLLVIVILVQVVLPAETVFPFPTPGPEQPPALLGNLLPVVAAAPTLTLLVRDWRRPTASPVLCPASTSPTAVPYSHKDVHA